MDNHVICIDCKYWLEDDKHKSRDNRKRGECRKSEPTLGQNGYGYWPMTAYNEFCFAGEPKVEVLNEQPRVLEG